MLSPCAQCRYAECHVLFTVMLSVIMLNVIMLNVVMLSVVAPFICLFVVTKKGLMTLAPGRSCLLRPCREFYNLWQKKKKN